MNDDKKIPRPPVQPIRPATEGYRPSKGGTLDYCENGSRTNVTTYYSPPEPPPKPKPQSK